VSDIVHLTEEDLVLYRYQESPDPDAVARHLAICAECRAEHAALERMFTAVEAPAPEPGPAYEREVWARIQDRLSAVPRGTLRAPWAPLSHWLWAPLALATVVAALFVAVLPSASNRVPSQVQTQAQRNDEPQAPQTAASIRNRVVLSAVGDHLQRAELMLTEFNNTDGHNGRIDLTEQQALAEDLISENRIYRHSAADANADQIVGLLDELERVLLEVAHAPTTTTPEQLDRLRKQLDTQDVLFKVRIVGAGMRDRLQMAANTARGQIS
jgi:hypothetical protein